MVVKLSKKISNPILDNSLAVLRNSDQRTQFLALSIEGDETWERSYQPSVYVMEYTESDLYIYVCVYLCVSKSKNKKRKR